MERERLERLPNGLPRWGEIRAYPTLDGNGGVDTVITIGFDITDRKLNLAQQKQRLISLEKKLEELTQWLSATSSPNAGSSFRLTSRERQVLNLMARGFSNPEISEFLSLSQHTVKSHVIHIFNKLGVNDRTEAVFLAAQNKLI
jgi:ATP/maltotriose-dependent transcriptional regulator MalT